VLVLTMRPLQALPKSTIGEPHRFAEDDIAKDGYLSGKHEVISLDAANGAKGARKGKGDR